MNTVTPLATNKVRRPTVDDLILRYELSNRAEGKSAKTITWYSDILYSFSSYFKENGYSGDISDFTIERARDYILFLKQKPRFEGHPYTPAQSKLLSPKTVQCHARALKAYSSWLYTDGYTSENRLKNLKLPKAPVAVIEPLTPEEIKNIIASINKKSPAGARNSALFITLLDTGLRASEIAGITLSNLNLTDGSIKVMGKGGKERIVPIGRYIQSTLLSYVDKVRPEPSDPECDRLFLSPGGNPITANTLKLLFLQTGQDLRCIEIARPPVPAHICYKLPS